MINRTEIETEVTKFERKKTAHRFWAIFAAIVAIGLVTAAVLIGQINVTGNGTGEAILIATSSLAFDHLPGESDVQNVSIQNLADVDLDVQLTWLEDVNPNSVTYTNDLPKTVTVPAGTTTDFPVSFTMDTGSELGTYNGTISVNRL